MISFEVVHVGPGALQVAAKANGKRIAMLQVDYEGHGHVDYVWWGSKFGRGWIDAQEYVLAPHDDSLRRYCFEGLVVKMVMHSQLAKEREPLVDTLIMPMLCKITNRYE